MSYLPTLALKSAWNRRYTLGLTLLAIALSVAMLLGIERLRQDARSGFADAGHRVDRAVRGIARCRGSLELRRHREAQVHVQRGVALDLHPGEDGRRERDLDPRRAHRALLGAVEDGGLQVVDGAGPEAHQGEAVAVTGNHTQFDYIIFGNFLPMHAVEVGLQIVGRAWDELHVLQAAYAFEQTGQAAMRFSAPA